MEIKESKNITGNLNRLEGLHQICLMKNVPFVSFHLPGKHSVKTLLQTNSHPGKLSSWKNIFENRGFIISPFKKTFDSFILEPDIEIINGEFNKDLLSNLENNKNFSSVSYANGKDLHNITKDKFIDQVNIIKDEINKGMLKKAVLSRVHLEKRSANFNQSQLFVELTKKYPGAFVYIFNIPEAGCWIGATPEPLMIIKDDVFETISLAGTQKSTHTSLDKVIWSQKELEEQDIVTRYIEEILTKFNINKYEKKGPFTYRAGNVMHLKTRFLFNAKAIGNKTGEFAEALNPTPSVCGLPKEKAFELIEKIEIHHREYYTGLLGPVNIDNETNLFVNLRCMKLLKDNMALFLGVGITSASNPEDEWTETNHKKMTLLSVIEQLNK